MDEKACDEWLVKNGLTKAGMTGKQLLDDGSIAPRCCFIMGIFQGKVIRKNVKPLKRLKVIAGLMKEFVNHHDSLIIS